MQITQITVYSYEVKYSYGTYIMSGGRGAEGHPSLVVRIRTDGGVEGWAESSPLGSTYLPSSFTGELAALKELSEHVLGLDPRCPSKVDEVMDRAMMGGMSAKSAIDAACWDAYGKAVGLPTHTLLGGCLGGTHLQAYVVIGPGDPASNVKQALAETALGVTAMQIKVGDDPGNDARRVKAVREAVMDTVKVWADANGNWTLEQALTFARSLGSNITMTLEQPCRSLKDCIELGRRSGLPIKIDEGIVTMNDLFEAHAGGVSAVGIKPTRVGGLTKARALRDAAVGLDMGVTIDETWGCALATMQTLQLTANTRSDRVGGVCLFSEWTYPLIAEIPRMEEGGIIAVPSLPGNGFGPVNLELLGEPLLHVVY